MLPRTLPQLPMRMAGRAMTSPRSSAQNGTFQTSQSLLQISKLNAAYGDVQVLWDVDLEVREGEIVALVGSNGAGKSTLLSTISGLLKPRSGAIIFNGQQIAGASSETSVKA